MTDCVIKTSDKRIVLAELGKSMCILNEDEEVLEVGTVDGCLVREGRRCDRMVSSEAFTIFVELKGCDVDHACQQLLDTVSNPKLRNWTRSRRLGFVIICSKYPKHDTKIQLAKNRIKKAYNARLVVKQNQLCSSLQLICSP